MENAEETQGTTPQNQSGGGMRSRISQLISEARSLSDKVHAISRGHEQQLAQLDLAGREAIAAGRSLQERQSNAMACATEVQDIVGGLGEFHELVAEINSCTDNPHNSAEDDSTNYQSMTACTHQPLSCNMEESGISTEQSLKTPSDTGSFGNRQLVQSGNSGLEDAGFRHVPVWTPPISTKEAKCAAFTTLKLSGYPWPNVLHTTLEWIEHHSNSGFCLLMIFLDEDDGDLVGLLRASLKNKNGAKIDLIEKAEMQSAWQQAGEVWESMRDVVANELSAKQTLNGLTALRRCAATHEDIEWLFCNLDLDEALCFSEGNAASLLAGVPPEDWQIVFLNHEAFNLEGDGTTWFHQASAFKLSPLLRLPFIGRCFPMHEEDPQILEHPSKTCSSSLGFWQERRKLLQERYGFVKQTQGGVCCYFDAYTRGKVAVRIPVAITKSAQPSVHRWFQSPSNPLPDPLVCSPASAALLHYFNCGGKDWFESKYCARLDEARNQTWLHTLVQKNAHGREHILEKLYDDIVVVPRTALEMQVSEGLVAHLSLTSFASRSKELFSSFKGWAVVPIDAGSYVHVPLSDTNPEAGDVLAALGSHGDGLSGRKSNKLGMSKTCANNNDSSNNFAANHRLWETYANNWDPNPQWVRRMSAMNKIRPQKSGRLASDEIRTGDSEQYMPLILGQEWSPVEDLNVVLLDYIIPYIGATSVVAEVGCGAGRIAMLVQPLVRHLTCMDISSAMLDHARKNLVGRENVSFCLLEEPSLASTAQYAHFDFIYCFDVMVHMDLHLIWQYLGDFYTALRPGGHVFIHTANLMTPGGWDRFAQQHSYTIGGFYFLCPQMVLLLLQRRGFIVVRSSSVEAETNPLEREKSNLYVDRDFLVVALKPTRDGDRTGTNEGRENGSSLSDLD